MEPKTRDIIKIILPDADEESLAVDAVTDEYLRRLGGCSLEQVAAEPGRLAEAGRALTEATQELALTNYRSFVDTAGCSGRVLLDLGGAAAALDAFLHKMPGLARECDTFAIASKNIIKDKRYNDQIQFQSDQLLGILELPILMQHALKQGDYESALDLFTYTRNWSRKYNDLPAFQNITSEVTKLWFETLHHLFSQLRYDLPLPQCLQVLGYLRRANAVYESAMSDSAVSHGEEPGQQLKHNLMRNVGDGLQLHFLKARGTWFNAALTDATNEDNDKQLRKIVELHRIHLFNILTQHKAIFLSETPGGSGTKAKGDELNGVAALSCWLKEKVNRLINILQQDAAQEDEATMESLMNQCLYLGLSFGRVGADMRAVMAPTFRNIIAADFSKSLRRADAQFENEMKHFKLVNRKMSKKTAETEPNQNGPPEILLDFYPLAEYCNCILSAFNSIKVIVPLCLAGHVLDEVSQSLTSVARALTVYYHREQQTFSAAEREVFSAFCQLFGDELVPYLQKCLLVVFSPVALAEQLGISPADVQEEKLLTLDAEKICSSVTEVLSTIKL